MKYARYTLPLFLLVFVLPAFGDVDREQLDQLRTEAVRMRAFGKALVTQGDKVIDQIDALLAGHDDTPEDPQPDPPPMDGPQAIARWNTVPFQHIDRPFEVEVLAFHINGIDRVMFTVNEGDPVKGERDGDCFRLTLDTDDYEGRVEIEATAYPKKGRPRVLAGPVHAEGSSGYPRNGEHGLPMFIGSPGKTVYVGDESGDHATILEAAQALARQQDGDAGGGTIYLRAGEHPWVGWAASGQDGNVPRITIEQSWLTIMPAPNVARSDVVIDGVGDSQGLRGRLVRLHNLTVQRNITTAALRSNHGNPTLWFDHCVLEGPDRTTDLRFAGSTSWLGGIYATDTTIRKTRNAVMGWTFARGITVEHIGADAFRGMYHVVNCTVRDLDNSGLSEHPDVIQWSGTNFENVVVYGLEATQDINAQPLFSRRSTGKSNPDGSMDNVAFVNLLLHSPTHSGQWQQRSDHLLMQGVSITGKPFLVRDDSAGELISEMHNWLVRDSVFDGINWWASEAERVEFVNVRTPEGDPINLDVPEGDE